MSDALFLILLAVVGFGVRQLTLALPIPEGAVRRYLEQQGERELGPSQYSPTVDEDWPSRRSSGFESDDDNWCHDDGVNIDGTPMLGDLDIHGNPFGITDDDW